MGRGQLSKLIAWVGDSAYSHAAMVIGNGELIEAATKGVRHASLAERTRMVAAFAADVGAALTTVPDLGAALQRCAESMDLPAWVARADAALYRAKAEGRNRVCTQAPLAAASRA